MARVSRSVPARKRRKKLLNLAKGYRGRNKNVYKIAKEAVEKGLQYAYRDRKIKKRTFRGLWIQRINAAVREHEMKYSTFMFKLKQHNIELNRKVLSNMAINEPEAFTSLIKTVISSKH